MLAYLNFPGWLKPEIIPGLPIRWYGLMYVVAFSITYVLVLKQLKQRKWIFSEEDLSSCAMWVGISLLLGARIFATLVYDTSGIYRQAPWLILLPFQKTGGSWQFTGFQGMSYHGGVLGGFCGLILYCWKRKQDFFVWADLYAAAIPLGYTFGRLGNFINGELYGRVSAAPWAIIFPRAESFPLRWSWVNDMLEKLNLDVAGKNAVNLPRHPSQLYEAFFEGLVLWALLWFVFRRKKPFEGFLSGMYLVLYGFFRFFIEYTRQPDAGLDFPLQWGPVATNYRFVSFLNITTGQILCFFMILAGGLFLWARYVFLKSKRKL